MSPRLPAVRARGGAGLGAVQAGSLRRERLQAFARTDGCVRRLVAYAAGVWMPGHTEVLVRPASILVADVAFAHITRHDKDFFGWPKNSCPAPCHRVPQADEPESTLHQLCCSCRDFGVVRTRVPLQQRCVSCSEGAGLMNRLAAPSHFSR